MLKNIARALLVASISYAPHVHAESISLVSGNEYAPFTGEDLPQGGLYTHLIRVIYESGDISVNIKYRPWVRGYKEVLSGKFDATYPYIWSAEREEEMLFSDIFDTGHDDVFIDAKSMYKTAKTIGELDGSTFCLPLGYAQDVDFVDRIKTNSLSYFTAQSATECLRLVLKGRADFFSINQLIAYGLIQKGGLNSNSFAILPINTNDFGYHLIFAKSDPDAKMKIQTFNRLLKDLMQSGQLKVTIDKYVDAHIKN